MLLIELPEWDNSNKDETKFQPKESSSALLVLFQSIDQQIVEQILDTYTDPTAPVIWNYLRGLYITSDLTAKSDAFNNLLTLAFPAIDMPANKAQLLALGRDLKTCFNNSDTISINDRLLLFALVNLPPQYHNVRTAIQVIHTTSNPLYPRSKPTQGMREMQSARHSTVSPF
jgi:hypothetical protein